MRLHLFVATFLAWAASACAQPLLQPELTGEWKPAASSPIAALLSPEAGPQIAEPEPGQFYLFLENGKTSTTRVYHSAIRENFGVAEDNADALHLVARFPIVGAQIIQHDGHWFLAGHEPGSAEMRVAPLAWKPVATPTTATSRPPGIHIRVALYDDAGSGGQGIPKVFEQLGRCGDIEVAKLNADGIRAGLSGYDVVIFTGGSGSRQANSIGLLGREQVRRFVEAGGGYVGICAGAYLACDGFSWGLKVLDAKTPSPKWRRGETTLEIEATPEGQKTLGLPPKSAVHYANGPVLVPGQNPAIPDYEPLVFFRTETAENGSPAGLQIGSPAMVRGAFGRGHVIVSSPHPEQTVGLETWAEHAVRAVAPSSEIELPEITEVIRQHFPDGSKGGIAALVVRDGQILHCKGYGRKGDVPITPDTPMGLASVTKQFTAMCVAMLMEEGKLKLTDKVSALLPGIPFPVNGRELLVQDLLWHTSGLANFLHADAQVSIAAYVKAHGLERLSNQTHAEWLATMPLRRPPGQKFEYTNSGYVLLARIVEVLAGKPFHEFQKQRIFDVLGMNETSDSTTFNGSGNILMSLRDYEKWDRALWQGSLVKPETWERIVQSGALDDGTPVGYGFGWFVTWEDGKLLEMKHSGTGNPPANSRNMILRDLRQHITVALFSRELEPTERERLPQLSGEIRDCAKKIAAANHALLQPVIAGDWKPAAASPIAPLLSPEPGEQIAEPEPGQYYHFFEKPAAAPLKKEPAPAPFTSVYHSTRREDLGATGAFSDALHLVARFPIVGAQVFRHEGQWFLAGHEPGSTEVRVAPLAWKPLATPTTAASRRPGISVRVALYDDAGSAGQGIPKVTEQLSHRHDFEVTRLNAEGIRAGLSGYDVVVFTGGSSARQANTLGLLGREQVRRFVAAGGGYVGICAGANLACAGYAWGIPVLDARTPPSIRRRGKATLEIEATPAGQTLLGLQPKSGIHYANGPVLTPGQNPDIPDYESLAFYRTEIAENGSRAGLQINSTAMARSTFGQGRVIVTSPHPEQTEGMEHWIEYAISAVAPKQ